MKSRIAIAFLAATVLYVPAFAQGAPEHDAHHPPGPAQTSAAMTPGVVRKVDKEAAKITLRHEAIASLDMPPMTMVFRVSNPKFLDQVKAGDKVRFTAEKIGGQMTVTQLESVN